MRRSAAAITASAMALSVAQRLVAVLARAEVDLRHALEPDRAQRVDQHRDLDAVADREGEALEQLAARRDLAGERLPEPGELGHVEVEERPRDELGHAAAPVGDDGRRRPAAAAGTRP